MAGFPSKRGVVQAEASRRTRYAMYGALFGATFVVLGTILRVPGELTGAAIAAAQRDPLMWVLDLMPGLTTVIGLFVGHMRDDLSLTRAHLAAAQNDVRVATRALEESTLQSKQRQDELERAKSDLNRFARVASHDLRAPLQAINSLAEWVKDDLGEQMSHEGHQHLALLKKRADRMGRLLASLQAYTLAGTEMGVIEPVDVKLLAHQVLQRIPGGKTFIMSFDGDDEPLHTSRAWLSTVLHVLLDNCVRHHDMPPGRIFVEKRNSGTHMAFVVADDGPGIANNHHEKIFGLFVTLERRDAKDTVGAGLAVAKRVVEALNCEIAILPQDGRGTRVRFTWPREQTAESKAADALARLSLKALSAKKDGPVSQR